MTAKITDLAQWRLDHPPAVQLMALGFDLWFSMATAFWSVGTTQAAAVFKFKPRSSSACHKQTTPPL